MPKSAATWEKDAGQETCSAEIYGRVPYTLRERGFRMHRKLLLLFGVTLGLSGAGCCMCDAPYDYCGPLFQGGCDDCAPDARMNSAFAPYGGPYGGGHEPAPHAIVQPAEQVPAPEPAAPATEMQTPPEQPMTPRQLAPNMTRDPRFRSISTERNEQ
jgi:hypothetical protein